MAALLLLAVALGLDNLAAAIGFGVGATGRISGTARLRIAVVFEEMSEDPTLVYPVSAYPVPPRRTRKRGSR